MQIRHDRSDMFMYFWSVDSLNLVFGLWLGCHGESPSSSRKVPEWLLSTHFIRVPILYVSLQKNLAGNWPNKKQQNTHVIGNLGISSYAFALQVIASHHLQQIKITVKTTSWEPLRPDWASAQDGAKEEGQVEPIGKDPGLTGRSCNWLSPNHFNFR